MQLGLLVAVVSDVAALVSTNRPFLIVRVEILDVQRASPLVSAELTGGTWLESLVLRPRSTLSVKVLPQVIIG